MFGRRKKKTDDGSSEAPDVEHDDTGTTDGAAETEDAPAAAAFDRSEGPYDSSEKEVPEDDPTFIDVGAMIVQGRPGLEVQIPTDPQTGVPTSVVALAEGSAVELRAFAAPRNGGLWDEIRPEIVTEVERVNGTVEEVDAPFGRELRVEVPVQTADGQVGVQRTRIVGVDGPRWLLRATFMGALADEPDTDHVLERTVRDVIVVRGDEAMPPREQIPVVVPAGAVPSDEQSSDDGDQG